MYDTEDPDELILDIDELLVKFVDAEVHSDLWHLCRLFRLFRDSRDADKTWLEGLNERLEQTNVDLTIKVKDLERRFNEDLTLLEKEIRKKDKIIETLRNQLDAR